MIKNDDAIEKEKVRERERESEKERSRGEISCKLYM